MTLNGRPAPCGLGSGIAAIALTLAQSGCREIIDADSYRVSSVQPDPAPFHYLGGDCLDCMAEPCSELLKSCEENPECKALSLCFGEAPGPGRRTFCEMQFPTASEAFTEIGRCMGKSCFDRCGGGRRWECLGQGAPQASPTLPGFEFELEFLDILSVQPLPGLEVRACARASWADPECAGSLRSQGTSDDSGRVALDIEFDVLAIRQPWDGYLTVQGPQIVPEIRYHTKKVGADLSITISSISPSVFAVVTNQYQIDQLPEQGFITVTVFDCIGIPAPGVSLELDVPSRRFYSEGGLELDEQATSTGNDGIALFSNVASGIRQLKVFVEESGAVVGKWPVYVAPGTRTALLCEADQPEE